jgi:glutathione S-transferase
MSLTLYFHPLSSFCQKTLIALYENETPFKGQLVNLGDETSRAEFKKVWPIGKFPVLRDEARNQIVPESSIIIEYLAQCYPGKVQLVPDDKEAARQTRLRDRFFDLHIHVPMQNVITDRLRPEGRGDPHGVEVARALIKTALGMLEEDIAAKTWAMGEDFTMADCAAAPTLFYTNMIVPLAGTYKNTAAYLDRLMKRPSYARALKEAEPYLAMVPKEKA